MNTKDGTWMETRISPYKGLVGQLKDLRDALVMERERMLEMLEGGRGGDDGGDGDGYGDDGDGDRDERLEDV